MKKLPRRVAFMATGMTRLEALQNAAYILHRLYPPGGSTPSPAEFTTTFDERYQYWVCYVDAPRKPRPSLRVKERKTTRSSVDSCIVCGGTNFDKNGWCKKGCNYNDPH